MGKQIFTIDEAQKNTGKVGHVHMIFSFNADYPKIEEYLWLRVTYFTGKLYSAGFNSVLSVHLDTNNTHIHLYCRKMNPEENQKL